MKKIGYSNLHIEAIKLAWQLEGINKKITKEEDFSEEIIERLKKRNEELGIKYFDKKPAIAAELIYLSRILPKDILIVFLTPAGDQELEIKLPQIIEKFKQTIEVFDYDSGVKGNPEDINCEH